MNRESPSFEAALSSLPAHDADIACIADAACMLWGRISGALAPIIGPKGVDALYRRSLHLTAPRHPVLSSINNDRAVGDFGSLREVLLSQTNAVAAAAHKALLINFHNLLSGLIGESLTERLLASVWDNPPGQCPRQERAP